MKQSEMRWRSRGVAALGLGWFLLGAPSLALALTEDEAIHLLRRTQFAVHPSEVERLLPLGRVQAVESLLARQRPRALTPERRWLPVMADLQQQLRGSRGGRGNRTALDRDDLKEELLALEKALGEDGEKVADGLRRRLKKRAGKLDLAQENGGDGGQNSRKLLISLNRRILSEDLKAWWWEEILRTDSQLNERMVLFWHNHFPADHKKVPDLGLLYDQNQLFRTHALGSFRTLLHAVSKHPAMLIYLDGAKSRKAHPNENFAREVMELFTLGEGNYTEKDIREAARAFTGWTLSRQTRKFEFQRRQHDSGMKTIFGRTAAFTGEQVLDLLLDRPETAVHLTRKLWREFVSPNPERYPAKIEDLASVFRRSGYDVSKLLVAMLSSDEFYAEVHRGSLIKSPVELIASVARTFGILPAKVHPLVQASRAMGQDLFMPPNVKGWPGHKQWITTHTLPLRQGFIDRALQGEDVKSSGVEAVKSSGVEAVKYGPDAWLRQYGSDPRRARERASRFVLALQPRGAGGREQEQDQIEGMEQNSARFVESLVQTPEFQLR